MYVDDEYSLVLTTAPTAEPVSLAEAKQHLRIDFSDHDLMIGRLISAAREYVEIKTGRQLCTATWKLTVDRFPRICDEGRILKRGEIWLPKSPLRSITSVKYLDANGTQQTLSTAVYAAVTTQPARIRLAYGEDWPAARQVRGAVEVTYSAGYGAASAVPAAARQAILLLVGHLYGLGADMAVSGTIVTPIPYTLEAMIGGLGDGYF